MLPDTIGNAEEISLTRKMTTAFKNPPFRISEEGWGEFDMQITLHADKDHYVTHDLNFAQTRYESKHVIVSVPVLFVRAHSPAQSRPLIRDVRHLKTPSLPYWQPFVNQAPFPETRME